MWPGIPPIEKIVGGAVLHSKNLSDTLNFFVIRGTIDFASVIGVSRTQIMDNILEKIHPYKLTKCSDRKNRWTTYIKLKGGVREKIVARSEEALKEKLMIRYKDIIEKLEEEEKAEKEKEAEKERKATHPSMNDLYQEFMDYKMKVVSPSTIDAYVKSYKRFYQNDPIADKPLEEITKPELETWLIAHVDKYEMDKKAYHKFSVVFSQLCEYACYERKLSHNPFNDINTKHIHIRKTKRKSSKEKAFSKEEAMILQKTAMDDFTAKPSCVPLAINFVFLTGLRIGEAVALKWEDVDWNRKKLRVCRSERKVQEPTEDYKSLKRNSQRYEIVNTKGEYGPREVDLPDDALYLLGMLQDYYEENGIESEWLFAHKTGKIHDRALDLRIRKLCRIAGIPERSLHKCRSTYVSMLVDSGMSYRRIAEEVGHRQILTTMNNYAFDIEEDAQNRIYVNSLGFSKVLNMHKYATPPEAV